MSNGLEWLPPDLYPVALRVARADECAYAIGELAAEWSFEGPIDLAQVRSGDRFTTRVGSIRPVPPRISVLFSEAVNHLRAALDNVVWHLVVQAQGLVTGRTATQVALPIYDDQARFDAWQLARLRAGLTAFGSTTELGFRIHALQPFVDQTSGIPSTAPLLAAVTGGQVETAHPLKLLQAYSNDDKHRTIKVAVPRTSSGSAGSVLGGPGRAFVELQVGDVVAEGRWGQPVLVEQTTSVLIQRPDPYAALVSPANEISRLATYVAHNALPQLVTGGFLPDSLPMKVDLDDSGLGELERLVAGDRQPAQERLRPWMTTKYLEAAARPVQFPTTVEEPLNGPNV